MAEQWAECERLELERGVGCPCGQEPSGLTKLTDVGPVLRKKTTRRIFRVMPLEIPGHIRDAARPEWASRRLDSVREGDGRPIPA